MLAKTLQNLISEFAKFPTVGKRTASRFVYYLAKLPETDFQKFLAALLALKHSTKICNFCFKIFEPKVKENLCEICSNKERNREIICLVEKEVDLEAIEKTGRYQGLYLVLDQIWEKSKKGEIEITKIKNIKERIKNPENFGIKGKIKEIIIATNPTVEGELLRMELEKALKPLGKKITRLARGLPSGGELEYADEETLGNALEGRK
jgi:recombination protein RecR